MKRNKWRILFAVCLLAFTTYISLDTFVVSRVWNADATQMNTSMFEESDAAKSQDAPDESDAVELQNAEDAIAAGNSGEEKSWKDENVSITVKEYRTNDTTVYVADVTLRSAMYLKTAFARDAYGRNVTQTVSAMAEANSAVLAINGDNYGSQEKGYVIRNGIVYRDQAGSADVLCIYADGSMGISKPSGATAQELVDLGVWQAFSFGPALVADSRIAVSQNQEVGKAMASNPRTAVGLIDSLHYVFVVADGRTSESVGLSLYELADFMQQLGVKTAYNLDGGGSSTMVFNGEIINRPTTRGNRITEREVNDIVYIGS